MKKSKLFSWNLRDFVKGLLMAILGSIVASIEAVIETKQMPTREQLINAIMVGGLSGMISYLAINFGTNSKGQMFKREPNANIKANGYNAGNSMQSAKKN